MTLLALTNRPPCPVGRRQSGVQRSDFGEFGHDRGRRVAGGAGLQADMDQHVLARRQQPRRGHGSVFRFSIPLAGQSEAA